MATWSTLTLLSAFVALSSCAQWQPCVELKRDLNIPCRCSVSPNHQRAIVMDCDKVVFTRDNLESLNQQPVVSLSQKNVGYQSLPENLINAELPLENLDLSGNFLQRLMGRLLRTYSGLKELRLADNLLGDNLNPIFSSNEFHEMTELRVLDLSGNGLRSIEEGIFKGCLQLEDLYLDKNNLSAVPAASLKGPNALRRLSLSQNNIGSVLRGAFSSLGESLVHVDLSYNALAYMEDDALAGLSRLLFFNVSHNDLMRFNSDVFKGAYNLLQLDLSVNFLKEFPTDALRYLEDLKFLNISNNLITEIERAHLSGLTDLQVLDLSRNNIARLGVNAFSSLSSLTRLDLSLNDLRTIEESSFEGLVKLKWLSLQDNSFLQVPASALARLPALTYLHIEFNRVAVLSNDLLRFAAPTLATLGLSRNLIREIPGRLFTDFERLTAIELYGNMLSRVPQSTFAGLEDTLQKLDLSYNRLTEITELPLRTLTTLNLSGNQLKRVPPETFKYLRDLQHLYLSHNPLYGGFPPLFPSSLVTLDISDTGLKILPAVLLLGLESLETITCTGNYLQEIGKDTFQYLYNLSTIDLSYNIIENIESRSFVDLINLYELNLRGNKLVSFGGEFFNTGTGLELLDLSENRLEYLSPTAFIIHPRLRVINLSDNRFTVFRGDLIKRLQFLEEVDLSNNMIVTVDEFSFAQMGRLRILDLSKNKIDSVDELAFHNSTQLQILHLADNSLELLSERAMEGLFRLEYLNLRNNKLTSLPETIFDPSRVRTLERINLSNNKFNEIPIRALQKQSSSLLSLNIANNKMVEVFTQDTVNKVKDLDLSGNPLSENAVRGILGDAKILRSLNLANTGIKTVTRLETPFLRHLNLSKNNITDINRDILERTTLLETLDISANKFADFTNLIEIFKTLPVLHTLDISSNDIMTINESSFIGLNSLRNLKISDLLNCTRIEKSAFKPLGMLRSLYAYNYPRLGYFDVQGILKDMSSIEVLDIDVKDSSVGNEQLAVQTHPRLRAVILRGERLHKIRQTSFVGVRSPKLFVGLKNTSIDVIPATLFSPVPRSTKIELDISGSQFSTIPQQFVDALEERSSTMSVKGLDSNPVKCDCEAKPLWRWLTSSKGKFKNSIKCKSPDYLVGRFLTDLSEDYLSCDQTTSTKFQTTDSTTAMKSTTSEPEIIWTVAPTAQDTQNKYNNGDSSSSSANASNTDDTLIFGIVGGVVAFIAIVIIVICICRLRWSNHANETRMTGMASSIHEASVMRPGSTYSGKANHDIYMGSYDGSTLGHGNGMAGSPVHTPVPMMPMVQQMHMVHPMHGHPQQQIYGYYENPQHQVYMT